MAPHLPLPPPGVDPAHVAVKYIIAHLRAQPALRPMLAETTQERLEVKYAAAEAVCAAVQAKIDAAEAHREACVERWAACQEAAAAARARRAECDGDAAAKTNALREFWRSETVTVNADDTMVDVGEGLLDDELIELRPREAREDYLKAAARIEAVDAMEWKKLRLEVAAHNLPHQPTVALYAACALVGLPRDHSGLLRLVGSSDDNLQRLDVNEPGAAQEEHGRTYVWGGRGCVVLRGAAWCCCCAAARHYYDYYYYLLPLLLPLL